MRNEDLRGQREALTDAVDDSGTENEMEAAEPSSPQKMEKAAKEQSKNLKDSITPAIMIAALLLTFGALAATAIYVVSRAFGVEGPLPGDSALLAANSTGL